MKKSKRSNVDPFIVMDVMESARKAEANGKHVIHMEVGQPGTPAPKRAKQFISDEISNNDLGYTVTLGLPELRNRISKLYVFSKMKNLVLLILLYSFQVCVN